MAWLVQRKVDMSGQAEQEFGRALGEKVEGEFGRKMGGWQVEREVTGKTGRWQVGGTQDVGRYVYPVREEREKNDVEEEKDVGKKVDTYTVQVFGHEIAGVEFQQQEVGECFECDEGWECDEKVGSMKAGQAQCVGSQVDPVVVARDSGEVDVNEQEADDEKGRKVGGMKEVGRYNGYHVDSGVEKNDDDGGIEKADVEDVDVDTDE